MSNLDQLVSELNPPQREAALHRQGPLLVIAGAGSGKTKTTIHRLACLLATGVPPEAVMCITFTNKAAREMQERAETLVGPVAKQVMIRTFHSAAVVLLREYLGRYPQAGRGPNFGIADPSNQLAFIKEAIAEQNFDILQHKPESFLWRIGRYKNEMAEPDSLLYRQATNPLMDWERVSGLIKATDRYINRITAGIWQAYEQKLRQNNLLDFDDLINLFVRLLIDLPDVRQELQERFRYIQVDEFQDTNIAQLQMVKLLAGETMNVMAVGDDYQSLYSWRSADIRCILDFPHHFPGAGVVKLEQNYRSTATILRAANKLIAHNQGQLEKELFTTVGEGWPIMRQEHETPADEAQYVALEIKRAVAMGRNYADHAILYRISVQSRALEERLREEGIPYQVVGGPRFYDRREVQDCFAYLKFLNNSKDSLSLERVLGAPKRGVGERGYQRVLALAAEYNLDLIDALDLAVSRRALTEKAADGATEVSRLFREARGALHAGRPFAHVVDSLIQDSGLLAFLEQEDRQKEERRAEIVRSVITGLYEYQQREKKPSLGGYLERMALDNQEEDKGGDQVRLMTIHASKGLEFPVVFVVGLEQGLLPNRRAMDEGNLEEERRLAYVAITRARDRLYLTNCRIRSERGEYTVTEPSQFLAEAL